MRGTGGSSIFRLDSGNVNARRVAADLEALRWTIQSLDTNRREASREPTRDADTDAELQRQAVLLGQVGRT